MTDDPHLRAFLTPLWGDPNHEIPQDEDWPNLIRRIREPGCTHSICDRVYRYFHDVLLPHYHGNDFFAFAAGEEPLLLFFRRNGTCLCRRLTWDETVSFCELAGIDLPD